MYLIAISVISLVSMTMALTPSYAEPASVTLVAGQHIDAGTVDVTVDANGICVKYTTTNDFVLLETHLWVGLLYADMPTGKKGNIKIGHFPYSSQHTAPPYPTTKEYCIPWSTFNYVSPEQACDQNIWIAAHASVAKFIDGQLDESTQETAWGKPDPNYTGTSWGGPFIITVKCDTPPQTTEPPSSECETAWARSDEALTRNDVDNYDFQNYNFSRWGWFQCTSTPGQYQSILYAGGGNHPQSSTRVGVMNYELTCNGGVCQVTIQYVMGERNCYPGTKYTLDEVHIRVFHGSPGYPNLDSVAPGQYEIPANKQFSIEPRAFESPIYTATQACVIVDGVCVLTNINVGDEVCIAAHAVACEMDKC